VAAQAGELPRRIPSRRHTLQRVEQLGQGDLGREVHEQAGVIGLAVELGQFRLEVGADIPHDLFQPREVTADQDRVPVLGDENQVGKKFEKFENKAPVYVDVDIKGHQINYAGEVQLRYNYRLYPDGPQREALARAFGCARVVFNDALAARRAARAAGEPYSPDAALSAALTASKQTPERAWLGEVSSVVLQQALADQNTAYRNFLASATGKRKGPKVAPPCFRSRKDRRQSVRFTANSRFRVLGDVRLRLPKIGDVEVRWSRALPAAPSSVTVVRDAAGRYFASFVVEASREPLPETGRECGIDLGLTYFADGRWDQDRRAEVPAARGAETEAGAAGPVAQAEGQREEGQGPGAGRAGARARQGRAPGLPVDLRSVRSRPRP
jgi:Helix-turn-helix domain